MNSISEVSILDELEASGCVWMREMMSLDECSDVGEQLDRALMNASSTLRNGEQVYGARNLIDVFPEACRLLEIEAIHRLCDEILGPEWGVVRGLFFDKPAGWFALASFSTSSRSVVRRP